MSPVAPSDIVAMFNDAKRRFYLTKRHLFDQVAISCRYCNPCIHSV